MNPNQLFNGSYVAGGGSDMLHLEIWGERSASPQRARIHLAWVAPEAPTTLAPHVRTGEVWIGLANLKAVEGSKPSADAAFAWMDRVVSECLEVGSFSIASDGPASSAVWARSHVEQLDSATKPRLFEEINE